jgi:hypothetical protein
MSNSSLARSGSSLMSDSSRPNIPHRSESATDHDRDRFGFTHQELLLRPPPQPGDLGQAEASGHSVPGAEGRAPSEPSATTQLPLRTALARDNATSPSHCTTTTQQALRTALEKFRPLCMPPEETVDYLLDSPDGLRLLANGGVQIGVCAWLVRACSCHRRFACMWVGGCGVSVVGGDCDLDPTCMWVDVRGFQFLGCLDDDCDDVQSLRIKKRYGSVSWICCIPVCDSAMPDRLPLLE